MSLDVYLTVPDAEPVPSEISSGIYVRRDGATVEVSREEWDRLHPGREPIVVTLPDNQDGTVYHHNVTHNLGRMAREAGLYDAMWAPTDQGWTHARQLIEPLRHGLATLHSDPEHFKTFNPENGWGNYDQLLAFAASYLAACMKWPDAQVRVWR